MDNLAGSDGNDLCCYSREVASLFFRSFLLLRQLDQCNYQLPLPVGKALSSKIAQRLVSLGGILSLLDENTEKGPVYALHRLNAMVDVFWPEISDSISKVYVLTHPSILQFPSSSIV
jgi:hypothetical protein